jgi:hypothetical protein
MNAVHGDMARSDRFESRTLFESPDRFESRTGSNPAARITQGDALG